MRLLSICAVAAGLLALSACARPPPFKEYVFPAWGFAASFRGPPKETDYPAAADGSTVHTFAVESSLFGRDNLVNVIDGSGSSKSDDQALADAPPKLAAYVGGTLGPITYAAVGDVMGREFLINRPGRQAARARIFVANKHLYELVSQSPLGPDDRETGAFLTSFRLTWAH
jgi:hypothetical protein